MSLHWLYMWIKFRQLKVHMNMDNMVWAGTFWIVDLLTGVSAYAGYPDGY